MRKLLLIALLLPMVVMGQKKKAQKSAISIFTTRTDSLNYLVGYVPGTFQTIRNEEIKPTFWIITGGDGKEAMKIQLPDSAGIVKGYINRKKIIWTSDSTFTIKTRE